MINFGAVSAYQPFGWERCTTSSLVDCPSMFGCSPGCGPVHEPVDSSFAGVLVDFPLVDDSTKITSLQVRFPLNDSPVHIDEEHRSVRAVSLEDAVDVFGPHEFTPRSGVAQDGHAILAVHLGPTDEASDRFRNEGSP